MTTKNRALAPFLFGLIALFAIPAHAGFYYEASSINSSTAGEQRTQVAAWSEGNSTRIEFREGNQMGLFGPGTYLISTDAGETQYLVNPNEKTYSRFDLLGMMNAAGDAMKAMGGMVTMDITDSHFEKVSEKPGGDILGYSTQQVTFNSGYTFSVSIVGMKMDQVVTSVQELWVTPAIDPKIFSAWLRPDKMMKGMFKGMGELVDAQFDQINGAPLKSIVKTTTTGGMGGQGQGNSTMTTEVTALRKEAIADSVFAIPQDYAETDLMDEMAREEPEQEANPGLQESMSKLKGLFGGKQ